MMKITTAMKNRIRAMLADAAEIPVKPNTPATMEMTRKIKAHFSMGELRLIPAHRAPGRALACWPSRGQNVARRSELTVRLRFRTV
jgi:hypothetical protein